MLRRALLALVLLLAVAVGVEPQAQAQAQATPAATTRTTGYLTMADGTKLAYTVVRPNGPGPYPTLFEYSGYDPGRNPDDAYIEQFVEEDGGYAYIGVNLRGTGCSEGTFDFFQPQEAKDGAAVIAWIRQQPWSNGLVGMIGKSYPGITQLFVAEEQPEGLAAIAPGHFFADAYRDVARPGGIVNHGFATLWSFIGRPSYEFQSSPQFLLAGDLGCLNGVTGELRGLLLNPFVQLLQHPFDDALTMERSPNQHLDRITVPMLATLAWQDEQLASRQTHLLSALDDLGRTNWWATLTNGDHSMSRTKAELADLERFYDHFLKGEANGWETRDRVQVWWESGRDEAKRAPGWTTGLDHWSEAERRAAGELEPWPLALRGGGGLTEVRADAGEAPTSYTYLPVLGTQGVANPSYALPQLPDFWFWDNPPPAGTAAAFTTEPLTSDRTVLGSASLDLWLTATAPDVDLQATITEVRPDGQEVFVEQGWLRASHRAIDPARSTALLPYQTHTSASPLTPGAPVLARVEVFPFGHLFRAGSRIRVWVEAPAFLPQLWAFIPSLLPAQVQVLHDAEHPSRLVLPLVPNDPERIEALPACGTLIRQPCRPDPLRAAAVAAPTTPDAPASPAGPESTPTPTPAGPPGSLPTTGATTTLPLLAAALATLAVLLRRQLAAVAATGSRASRKPLP